MIIDLNTTLKQYDRKIKNRTGTFYGYCPECRRICQFWRHGYYERNVVYWDGKIREKRQKIERLYCTRCRHTHAVLPYDVIPMRVYSLSYFVRLFRMLFFHKKSVLWCQKHMEITARNIYLILKSLQRCLRNNVEFSAYMSKTNTLSSRQQSVIRIFAEISVSDSTKTAFITGFS